MLFCLTYIEGNKSCIFTFKEVKFLFCHVDGIENDLRIFIKVFMRYYIKRRICRRKPESTFTFNNIMSQADCQYSKSIGWRHMRDRIKIERLSRSANVGVKC